MSDEVNDNLILVSGVSTTGKSRSLKNLKPQEGVMYLNCEAGKKLPFPNKFETFVITDPYQVYEAFDHAAANPDLYHTIVIDSLTFLMDMFESMYVLTAADTRTAWGGYQQFFKTLMQDKVAKAEVDVIFTAHTLAQYNEEQMVMENKVPVKGSLKSNGIEAYFSVVVSTKKMKLKDLEKFQNDLLHITEDDEDVGFKYVFQTRLTKDTVNERIRAPEGMWARNETYIDNDVALVLQRIREHYAD